jgi:hypothetical protein
VGRKGDIFLSLLLLFIPVAGRSCPGRDTLQADQFDMTFINIPITLTCSARV